MSAVLRGAAVAWIPRAIILGLFAFVIFGPLANMLLWAVAEVWYFPSKLPIEWGFRFWQQVFKPRGNAMLSLNNSILIAVFTVIVGGVGRSSGIVHMSGGGPVIPIVRYAFLV